MSRKRLTIVSCSVYAPELTSLSRSGKISYPIRFADSSLHMRPDSLQSRLQAIINEERSEGRSVVLLYGDCSCTMSGLTSQPGVYRVKGNNCGDILLGKERYKTLMKEGALLLFPEWVDRWRQILLNFPGMGEELACSVMQDVHKKFAYINTGLRPVPNEHLRACSTYFGLPYEIVDVNLHNIEKLLSEAIDLVPDDEMISEPDKCEPPDSGEQEESMSLRDRGTTALMHK